MLQYRGYSCRIYPNKEQKIYLNKIFGCTRFVYNFFLQEKIKTYEESNKTLNKNEISRQLTQLKRNPEYIWLNEVPDGALRKSLEDLENAYKHFFRRVKSGSGEKPGFPKFKSRKNTQSFSIQQSNNYIYITGNKIKLPKMEPIRIEGRTSTPNSIRIMYATVRLTPSGKYFVSLCTEEEVIPKENKGGEIGLALNMSAFYTTSDGITINLPDSYSKHQRRLVKLQKKLSRKKEGSANYQKARIPVAKKHEKIANVRKDFLHKETTKLVRENKTIVIPEIDTKNLMRENKKLAKTLADISWYMFSTFLEYKSFEYGTSIVKLPVEYQHIQICPNCNYEDIEKKDPYQKYWICPSCKTKYINCDNQGKSIFEKGIKISNE